VTTRRMPGFLEHVLLLWKLRLDIGFNQGKRPSRLLAGLSFLVTSSPALGLGAGFYRLLSWGPVADSAAWCAFILNLSCFVTTAVWVTWPILSAGVDDHSELSRYSAFPISPFRLLFASTLATLAEPRALVIYAPLIGATLGYAQHHPLPLVPALLMFALYAVHNAAWSRVGLHVVLNVLRQEKSAEILGGGFLVMLFLASLIPPVDTSWLTEVGNAGLQALGPDVLVNAAVALGRVPPGFFGDGVWALAHGAYFAALMDCWLMVLFTAMGFLVAYALLLQFHSSVGRAGPRVAVAADSNPFSRKGPRTEAMLLREALDLWRNPRARLLAAVPFLLAILLKLLSGRSLFAWALGESADAWLLGGLALYGAVVIASTFAQNTFAYDGHGFAVFLAAPMSVGDVLKAKNRVHAASALGLGALVVAFYLAYFRAGGVREVLLSFAAILALLPVLLTAGNFLSLYFPVKFHASLKRRDKLPFTASMLGVAAASLGAAPFAWALRACGKASPGWDTLGVVCGAAVAGWALYAATLPTVLRLLEARRELVLRAVTRD
jgi:ABC-2 type transport system permease protein